MKKLSTLTFSFMIIALLTIPHMVESNLSNRISLDRSFDQISMDGTIGDIITSSSVIDSIYDCTESSLAYIGCDDYNPSSKSLSSVTVGVIDVGLTTAQWNWLESPSNPLRVDIVAYVTDYISSNPSNTQPVVYTSPGSHVPSGYSEQHGAIVVNALGSIARNVRVVFIDVKTEDTTGFDLSYKHYLDWVINNAYTYDIDVLTFSGSMGDGFGWPGQSATLKSKGIFMLSTAGNDGLQWNAANFNNFYPQYLPEWYAVGGIDHENRGKWIPITTPFGVYNVWDSNYYSDMNRYWGYAVGTGKEDSRAEGMSTSWGTTDFLEYSSDGNGVDFVMPANGIPASFDGNQWYYWFGTSISTAILAGVVAVIIDAYQDGRVNGGGSRVDPSVSTVFSILMDSANNDKWNYMTGWGAVNVNTAYLKAINQGYADARGY